ncbi:MAG: class I SAM-dependent methyltransferase [Acidimicrobiales bacterium]
MGIYKDHIVPRIVNWTCSSAGIARWRQKVCAGLSGDVVEIGFGSGTNVAHYPEAVRHVFAVEPAPIARKLARKRIEHSSVAIEHIGTDGQRLALADESCDAALVTFTLCTIKDPHAALLELFRVLKPGATLHFLEHGIAPDDATARWQRRLNGIEQRVADGCQLIRDPLAMVREAGFEIQWSEQRFVRGPKPWSYFSVGVAIKASSTTAAE